MELIHATAIEPLLCDHCASRLATRFLEPDSPHDLCCEECFAKLFRECPSCGAIVLEDDLRDVCVSRQTRWEPAEYETRCVECVPTDYDPDEERD